MSWSRDPSDLGSTPEFAIFANASSQSTNPLGRIRQVRLSMMLWRQRSPVVVTTSMEPVLSAASLDAFDRVLADACIQFAMTMPTRQNASANPQARTARLNSPASRLAADGLGARMVPVTRMWL